MWQHIQTVEEKETCLRLSAFALTWSQYLLTVVAGWRIVQHKRVQLWEAVKSHDKLVETITRLRVELKPREDKSEITVVGSRWGKWTGFKNIQPDKSWKDSKSLNKKC